MEIGRGSEMIGFCPLAWFVNVPSFYADRGSQEDVRSVGESYARWTEMRGVQEGR